MSHSLQVAFIENKLKIFCNRILTRQTMKMTIDYLFVTKYSIRINMIYVCRCIYQCVINSCALPPGAPRCFVFFIVLVILIRQKLQFWVVKDERKSPFHKTFLSILKHSTHQWVELRPDKMKHEHMHKHKSRRQISIASDIKTVLFVWHTYTRGDWSWRVF